MNTSHKPIINAGIDVSKDHLDVFVEPWPTVRRFRNTPAGRRKLLDQIRSAVPEGSRPRLVMEASGGYENCLHLEAWSRGVAASRCNARQVRDFARSAGILEKTDAIDARVLALFGERMQPRAGQPPREAVRTLSELVRRRQVHADELQREKTRLAGYLARGVHRKVVQDVRASIKALEKRRDRLQKLMAEVTEDDDLLAANFRRLTSVSGIGSINAWALLAEVPELAEMTGNEASKMVGVAPLAWDSGNYKGRRRIMGGRPLVRRLLYCAAMSAIRHNAVLRPLYERLLKAGKKKKQALVAVMRKLLRLACLLLSDPDFELQKDSSQSTP